MKLKEIQRLDYVPKKFDNIILRNRYSVFKSKIFYFYDADGNPYPQGILETEDLWKGIENYPNSHYLEGPVRFQGSNRFFITYRGGNYDASFKVHI